jgi:hypothetical protein
MKTDSGCPMSKELEMEGINMIIPETCASVAPKLLSRYMVWKLLTSSTLFVLKTFRNFHV